MLSKEDYKKKSWMTDRQNAKPLHIQKKHLFVSHSLTGRPTDKVYHVYMRILLSSQKSAEKNHLAFFNTPLLTNEQTDGRIAQ